MVETGLWPLKEAISRTITHTYIPKRKPVEEYLKLQGRFRYLFVPTLQKSKLAYIQERMNTHWEQVKRTEQTA